MSKHCHSVRHCLCKIPIEINSNTYIKCLKLSQIFLREMLRLVFNNRTRFIIFNSSRLTALKIAKATRTDGRTVAFRLCQWMNKH